MTIAVDLGGKATKQTKHKIKQKTQSYSFFSISTVIGDGVFLGSDEHLENARNVLWRSNFEEIYDTT